MRELKDGQHSRDRTAGCKLPASAESFVRFPQPLPNTPGGPAALKFDPGTVTASANSTFSVNIVLTGGRDVYSVPIQITYDPAHLQLVNIASGDLLSRDNQPIAQAPKQRGRKSPGRDHKKKHDHHQAQKNNPHA